MDFLGWFGLGFLGALVITAQLWGQRVDRRRAAGARAWASSVGLAELPHDQEGVPHDLSVKRLRAFPSFIGTLDGRQVSVIATSTRPRRGRLWALCTHATRPPIFLGNTLDFSTANAFGLGAPKGWERVSAGADVDRHFLTWVPGSGVVPSLSDDARAALSEANVHAFSFNANPSGFTVLWFKETYGQDTQEALAQARRLLARLVA